MSAAWDSEDVSATLGGIFHLSAKLTDIANDVDATNRLLEDDDEEEAPEDS